MKLTYVLKPEFQSLVFCLLQYITLSCNILWYWPGYLADVLSGRTRCMDTRHTDGCKGWEKASESCRSSIVFSAPRTAPQRMWGLVLSQCWIRIAMLQSLFQWVNVEGKKYAYDRNMSVWKPKPAVAWMCQVQTSLCVLNKECRGAGKARSSFMGAPSALMESERQLCTPRPHGLF